MEKTAFKSIHNRRRYPSSYCYGIDENKRFKIWKISSATLRNLWRHLPTELWNVQCIIKNIWSSNKWRKLHSNRFITADAILPHIATELTKTSGSKFGGLLWRHLTQYRCTTTVPHVHNSLKDVLENLLPVWLLVHKKTCLFRAIFGVSVRTLTFAVSAI